MALEGVRGLAALIVVIHHFALAFYPMIHFGPAAAQHMRFEDNINGSPLGLLFAGTFAVSIFFVLSGFVLSIGFFQTKKEAIIKKLAIKRYFRLMLPALTATLICLVLIKLGFANTIANVAGVTRSEWLADTWVFNPDLFRALYSGTIGIFVQSGSSFNNVLWTMFIEFLGSFMVFGFVLVFGLSKHRWIAYGLLGVLTFNTWFWPFIIGTAIADLYASGKLEIFRKARWTVPFLAIGLLLGSYPVTEVSGTGYEILTQPWLDVFIAQFMIFYLTIGAALVITAVLMSRRLTSVLEKRPISALGKYTFSLYLIHLPILYSAGMVSFILISPHVGYNVAVLLTLLTTLPIVWGATILFEKYVDAPSIRFAKYFEEIFEGRRATGLKKYATAFKRRMRRITRGAQSSPEFEESPAE